MKLRTILLGFLFVQSAFASPHFVASQPLFQGIYDINGTELCATAKQTLAYLHQGSGYDPHVIHDGKVVTIPLNRVKATLTFICANQDKLNNPNFVKRHFDFMRWYPDKRQASLLATNKPLLKNLPADRLLMTKYYVHLAHASSVKTSRMPYALHGLPADERGLTLEDADKKPGLIRLNYGKQAILAGALNDKPVPVLAYVSREDLEAALLQGTVVVDFDGKEKKYSMFTGPTI